ncbi:MAG: porin [Burkholderiaceae bacterium]|jgi:predicted porin|nr:porin [Burkholderiaceae bacterium]
MKNSLIVMAAVSLSGVAMAQSSVTMYGIADGGYGKNEYNGQMLGGSTKAHFQSGAGVVTNAVSRIGVRGVEDLGGGMKVGFNFETGLQLSNGANLSSGQGGGFWGRNANVWVGGPWGTLKLGRSVNPSVYGIINWELTTAANYSVVAVTYNWGGSGPRNNSQISYATPNFNGFSAEVAYVTKYDNVSVPGALVPGDPPVLPGKAKWDLNLKYTNGPFSAALTANKMQSYKTNYSVGARYKFGTSFIVAASYSSATHTEMQPNPSGMDNTNAVRRGFSLGGTALFGPFSVTLDLTRDTKNEWYHKKYTNGVLELKYALSKRTFLYGVYLRADGTDNVGIGMRHNF